MEPEATHRHGCPCEYTHYPEAETETPPRYPEVFPEGCPQPTAIELESCKDAVEVNAGEARLASLGRILQLDVTLKNVCPGKRVALAAILTEADATGQEHDRGTKTLLIPAHTRPRCSDVRVRRIHFVLPEVLDPTGPEDGICDRRHLRVRFIAHYIDSDYRCCDKTDGPHA